MKPNQMPGKLWRGHKRRENNFSVIFYGFSPLQNGLDNCNCENRMARICIR